MKVIKKFLVILLIFIIIQVIFTNYKIYANNNTSISQQIKNSKQMAQSNSALENAVKILIKGASDIYYKVYIIGIGVVVIAVSINVMGVDSKIMGNIGSKIAGSKKALVVTFILAILFVFAVPIANWFIYIFEQIEAMIIS